MIDDKKEKQAFLFKEVIEKNYDPEQFQEFLMNSKSNGDDLDNWKLSELKQVVYKFQRKSLKSSALEDLEEEKIREKEKQKKKQKKQIVEEKQKNNEIADIVVEQYDKSEFENENNQENNENLEFNNQTNEQNFSRIVNCIIIPPNSLLTKEVNIKITKFQKKEGGMFEQSYVSYFVHTHFLNKTVQRRYSDFQWLKQTLELLHPGMPVPPIAKKGQFRRYDDKHLSKRMMILEMFLSKCLEIPELRAEQVLENFLKFDDRVVFQKFKATLKKNNKLTPLKNIKNIKGKLTLGFDPKMNNFLLKTQKYFQQAQPNMKNIFKQFKGTATALENAAEVLEGISSLCDNMEVKDKQFRKDNELNYCQNNFFTILSQSMKRLSDEIYKQANLFRTEMYSLVKYENLYMMNILDNFESLASYQKQYEESKLILGKKKNKLYEEGNQEKWNLDKKIAEKASKQETIQAILPQETKKLTKLRDTYGLFNFQMYEELHRHFSMTNIQLGKHLQPLCRHQTKICSEMMMIWVDMETNIMGIKENKYIQKC